MITSDTSQTTGKSFLPDTRLPRLSKVRSLPRCRGRAALKNYADFHLIRKPDSLVYIKDVTLSDANKTNIQARGGRRPQPSRRTPRCSKYSEFRQLSAVRGQDQEAFLHLDEARQGFQARRVTSQFHHHRKRQTIHILELQPMSRRGTRPMGMRSQIGRGQTQNPSSVGWPPSRQTGDCLAFAGKQSRFLSASTNQIKGWQNPHKKECSNYQHQYYYL